MKNIKKILVLLIMAFVSIVSLTACGDPYENMTLTIENGGFENALGRRYEYSPLGNTFDITAIIDGVDGDISTDVVFSLEDTRVINMTAEPVKSGNKTTQTFNVLNTGDAIIYVSSVEGELREKIDISIYANPDEIAFIDTVVPVIKGQTIDFTKISGGYSKAPITFEPAYATEKSVSYRVFEDADGHREIYPGGQYVVSGNEITFKESIDLESVFVRAISVNNIETEMTEVKLLTPIDISQLGLSYTYTGDDINTNERTFFNVDKSREDGVDYEIFLADQYSGDEDRDAKNLYLTTKSGKKVVIANDYSLNLINGNTIENSYIYSNNTGTNKKQPCFSICNGSGEGNFDILTFNINYKGYENFFVGYDITLKITIDAFPADVVISPVADIDAVTEQENIMIYNTYVNQLGTPFYVKILNKGGEYIQNQYAYVNVYDTATQTNADGSYFNIYDANGNSVTTYTKIKSGSLLYIKYIAIGGAKPGDDSTTAATDESVGRFVLYGCSTIDSTITSLEKEDGVTDEIYEFNNLKLAALNYSVGFTNADGEITLLTNDASLYKANAQFLYCQVSGGVTINADYPAIDEFVLTTNKPDLISIAFDGNNYVVTAVDPDYLGSALITIVAPNGTFDSIEVHVTKSPTASTFELLVGNNLLQSGDEVTLNVNVNSKMIVTILIDGIKYSTMPHGYSFSHTYTTTENVSGFSDDTKVLSVGSKKTESVAEKYEFFLNFAGADASSAQKFTVNIYVVKPVNNITKSVPQVDMLFNQVEIINNSDVDSNIEHPVDDPDTKAYTDISYASSSTVQFSFNPEDSSIQPEQLAFDFKYNGKWITINNFTEKAVAAPAAAAPEPADPVVYIANVDYDPDIMYNGASVYVKFSIEYYILNDKVIVTVYDVQPTAGGNLNISLKLRYTQEYKLSVQKEYYIEEVKNADGDVVDVFFLTDLNKPTTSRVQYIGGQKMSLLDISGSLITINGVSTDIYESEVKIPGTEQKYKAFTYGAYKVEISSQLDYIVKTPVKTETISFVGVNYETTNTRYYVSGVYNYDSDPAVDKDAPNGEYLKGFYLSTGRDGSGRVTEITPFDGKLDYKFEFDGEIPIKVTIDGSKTYTFAQMDNTYNTRQYTVVVNGEGGYSLSYGGKIYNTIFNETYTIEKTSPCGACSNCFYNQTELCENPILTLTHQGGAKLLIKAERCNLCENCLMNDPLIPCSRRNHNITSDTIEVQVNDVIEFGGYEGLKYFNFEERLSYQSKTINKNQIDELTKQVYYIGNDGTNNYLYTNILQPAASRIYYIGGYVITNANFIIPEGETEIQSVQLNTANFDVKEVVYDSVIYKYIEIASLKLHFKTYPSEVQVRGLLFKDSTGIISKFNYVNGTVIGCATMENISDNYGISIAINYSVDYVEFLILDTDKFETQMRLLNYEWMLTFVSADSYQESSGTFKVSKPFGLKLATGTADNPYVIEDAKSFMAIAKDNTAYYRVIKNISLFSINNFTPFDEFSGHITTRDNLEYSISDFNINMTYDLSQTHYGMFRIFTGSIENIIFKNFKVSLNVATDLTITESKVVYFGALAGESRGSLVNCKFIDDESTNYDKYAVSNIANTSPYGVSLVNNNKISYPASGDPLTITYYVGGIAGNIQNSGTSDIENLQALIKTYILVNGENQVVYAGGVAGVINNTITKATVYSVLYVGNSHESSVAGGVAGINKSSLIDLNVTTYISAHNNVGGVAGQAAQHTNTINTAVVAPYIRANDNVGGLIGSGSVEINITSAKVQFIDRVLSGNQTSKTYSAIIANNNIGGMVGTSTTKINISYSSVVSYMTTNLSLLTTFAEVETSRNKYIGDIISKYAAARIGGFVGNTVAETNISNSYYDANVVSYGNLQEDIGSIYFGGLVGYNSASQWGSISTTSVEGEFYYLSDDYNTHTVIIGGFVGYIADQGLAFNDYTANGYLMVSYDDGTNIESTINKNHYTIFNSYTALKYAKINAAGTTANYIDNFVGVNEKISTGTEVTITDFVTITAALDINGDTLTITYTTPDVSETIVHNDYLGDSVQIDINGDGNIDGDDIEIVGSNSETRQIAANVIHHKANVLTYNSFYIGFETYINFVALTEDVSDPPIEIVRLSAYSPIDKLEKITFTEDGSISNSLTLGGLTFNYYSGRATDGVVQYAAMYDNLRQTAEITSSISATANVAAFASNMLYSAVAGDMVINDQSLVNNTKTNEAFITSRSSAFVYLDQEETYNYTVTDPETGDETTIIETRTVRNYYKKYMGFENLLFDADRYVSYSVTDGTKLNAGDTNELIKTNGYDTYFNNTKDGQNYNIANGRPVPFADYNNNNLYITTGSDVPKLVIDIAPTNIVAEVKADRRPEPQKKDTALVVYYSLSSEELTEYNQLTSKDKNALSADETQRLYELEGLVSENLNNNRLEINNIIDITVVPELASNDVIYESDNNSVVMVSGDAIVVTGEGVAVLTVRSKLNSSIFMEVYIVSVGFDFDNIDWSLYSSNTDSAFDSELNIVANSGDFITHNIGYRGDATFGVRYEFTTLDISGTEEHGKSSIELVNAFNIAGKQLKDYNTGGTIQLNIDGLNHAMSCQVLGSVVIKETLYFKYVINGVEYYKYFTTTAKTITYNFVEGLFGIDGSDEINIVTINSDTFSIVLETDAANAFEIEMRAKVNGIESDVFSGFTDKSVVEFSKTVGGYLTISVQSIDYDIVKKLQTYVFRAYVKEDDQPYVNNALHYELTFWAKGVDKSRFSHTVDINVKPQEIDSVYINHYSNVLFTVNSNPTETSSGNYKYPSDIIMPDRQSLLQVDIFPSFGKFDYMTIVANTPGIVFNQVIESFNFAEGYNREYSWYESYTSNQTAITNGIKLKDKYSYKNYNAMYGEMLGFNGSIYVALSTGDKLSGQVVTLTVSCFVDGQEEAVYIQTIDLKVEARPAVDVEAEKNEFIFGETIKLNISVQHTESGFKASLKPVGELVEYIDVLASIMYSTKDRSYILKVNDGRATYEMFHDYMYREFELSISASKLIDGVETTTTETIILILVPFEIAGIDFNLIGTNKTNHSIIAEYYQLYEVSVKVVANYSYNYASWLKIYKNSENMEKQINAINNTIADRVANSSILKQGTAVNRKNLLSAMQYEYNGEFNLQFISANTPATTTIRFVSTEISGFIWAEIGVNYTIYGIEITNSELATYILNDYFSVVIDTASTDDRPEPITSVKDFMNMREGVSYILMKDLYLENWMPMDAKFSSFDGNGFVLSLVSFADVSGIAADENGNFNIGIFKSIGENQIVKNVIIEVNPSSRAANYTEEDIENGTYDDKINTAITGNAPSNNGSSKVFKTKLFADISALGGTGSSQQVSFGLLAGTNKGSLTNINIVNNATSLREVRESALDIIYRNNYGLRINYGDNFALSIAAFKNVTDTDTVRVSYLKENQTTTLSRNNQIALLVGTNSGYITNSSVDNVSIEGEDYIAGLVARNVGKISSSYFSGGNVISGNILGESGVKSGTGSAGFVAINSGDIYYSYVKGNKDNIIPSSAEINTANYISNNANPQVQQLLDEYNGSGIITGSYAGGFVFENTGRINNSYARILVAGNNSSGFAHKNEQAPEGDNPGSVIEFCYAISDIRKNDNGSFPFTGLKSKANQNVESGGTITDCFYLTTTEISTTLDDAATGLEHGDFSDHMAFVGYAFNVDYQNNQEIMDGAWFIPTGSATTAQGYLKRENVANNVPELINANQRVISLRYLISADDASAAYTYSYVQDVNIAGGLESGRGSVLNPILISSASNFNKQVVSAGASESRNFRFINDIQFSEDDEVATTYNATFSGKLDGNGMTIKNLRISADEVKDDGVTRLGLFAQIKGYPLTTDGEGNPVFYDEHDGTTSYAVVKNLNVEIVQIDGMNINMVGVLAGEVDNGKIYNITVSGDDDVVIQGLNAVGGVAGRVKGETDLVNITSNVSVKANYFYEYNAFTSFEGHKTTLLQDFYVYRNFSESKLNRLIETSIEFGDVTLQKYLSWKNEASVRYQYIGVKSEVSSVEYEVRVKFGNLITTGLPVGADGNPLDYSDIWEEFKKANFVTSAKFPGTTITFAEIIGDNRTKLINLPYIAVGNTTKIEDGETFISVDAVAENASGIANPIYKAVMDRRELTGYAGDNIEYVSYAGGIVGICENNKYAPIETILAAGKETQPVDETRANMYRSRRLYTEGDVSIAGEVVGGIFGYLSENSNMSDCELVAGTSMKLSASRIAGGLIGHNEGDIKRCYVENINQEAIDADIAKNYKKYDNATSDIALGTQTLFQSNAMYIGGLVGINYNAKIEYAYNKVNVVNKESLYAGGAVGLSIQSEYNQIYTTGSVYAYRGIGGFIGLVTTNIEAIDFYDNFANADAKYIFAKLDSTASITSITNVVIANIWSYSHLNINRDTLANPNSTYASIGMIAGKYEDVTEFGAEEALGLQDQTLANRAKTDNIYYKQTFTYNTVKNSNNKQLIREIGEGYQVNVFLTKTLNTAETIKVSATEMYNIEDESYLRYLIGTKNVLNGYYTATNSTDRLATVQNHFMQSSTSRELKAGYSSIYQYYENNTMSLISGKFRDSFNTGTTKDDQVYYSYSRMASFGSFRSLEEIYSRKLIVSNANELYTVLAGANSVQEDEEQMSVWFNATPAMTGNPTKTDAGADAGEDTKASITPNNIYDDWNTKAWFGVGLDSEGKRTEVDYVFPHLKNSKDVFSMLYIYNAEDLLKIKSSPSSQFILMNDIYLSSSWTPVCGDSNPFKGIIRSARNGDVDGTRVVNEDQVFTIFNLKIETPETYDSKYVGFVGYSDGGTFSNINLHITSIDATKSSMVEYVGGLVGCADNATFNNVTVFGGNVAPATQEVETDTWMSRTQTMVTIDGEEINLYNNDYCMTKKYGSTKGLLDKVTPLSTDRINIATNNASFVGGISGRASNCTIVEYYEVYNTQTTPIDFETPERFERVMQQAKLIDAATDIVEYTNDIDPLDVPDLVDTYWYPTLGVYNLNILSVGSGYSTRETTSTMMSYYVGGAFGDIVLNHAVEDTLINSGGLNADNTPKEGTIAYSNYTKKKAGVAGTINQINNGLYIDNKMTIRDVNISTTFIQNATDATKVSYTNFNGDSKDISMGVAERMLSFDYDVTIIPTGLFVGGFTGRLSKVDGALKNLFNGLSVLDTKRTATGSKSISVDVSYGSKDTNFALCANIKFGGLIGLTDINVVRDIVVLGEVEIKASQPSGTQYITKEKDGGTAMSKHMIGGLIGSSQTVDIQYLTTKKNVSVIIDDTNMGSDNACESYVGGMIGNAVSTTLSDIYTLESVLKVSNVRTSKQLYPTIRLGGMIGMLDAGGNGSSLRNSIINADLDINHNSDIGYYGGFAGVSNGSIERLNVSGQIDIDNQAGDKVYAGGLVGANCQTIDGSAANVNIYVNEEKSTIYRIGGIAGVIGKPDLDETDHGWGNIFYDAAYNVGSQLSSINVTQSYSSGNIVINMSSAVDLANNNIGGIAGYSNLKDSTLNVASMNIIRKCWMVGTIYFKGNNNKINEMINNSNAVGGILGASIMLSNVNTATVDNCVYNKDHLMITNDYGMGYTTDEMLFNGKGLYNGTNYNTGLVNSYQKVSWLNYSDLVGTSSFISESLRSSINDYANTRQAEGTKINPMTLTSNSFSDLNDGSYTYGSYTSDLRTNVAYIWDLSASKWTTGASYVHELVNTTMYFKGPIANATDGYFASIDKNSILNGFKMSSGADFLVYNNEGYMVNCNFTSTDPASDLVTSNSGIIINSKFKFAPSATDTADVALVGYTKPMTDMSLAGGVCVDPGMTLYSTFIVICSYENLNSTAVDHFDEEDSTSLAYKECQFLFAHTEAIEISVTGGHGVNSFLPAAKVDNCVIKQYKTTTDMNNDSIYRYILTGDPGDAWHDIAYYESADKDGNYAREYDISAAYYSGKFEFINTWTWLESTDLPKLQVFLKTHWHDKTVPTQYSWDLMADGILKQNGDAIKTAQGEYNFNGNVAGKDYAFKLTISNTGAGTFDNISNAAELAYALKYYGNKGYTINITDDIFMKGKVWTPYDFTGTFEGNEHTISDIMVISTDAKGSGLFKLLGEKADGRENNIVQNLVLRNVTTLMYRNAAWKYFGAVSGWATAAQLTKVGVEGYNIYRSGIFASGREIDNGLLLGVFNDNRAHDKFTTITDCYGAFEINAINTTTSSCNEIVGAELSDSDNGGSNVVDKIIVSNYYSLAYNTTNLNNVNADYLVNHAPSGLEKSGCVDIVNTTLSTYQGLKAESALPSYDFIVDWEAETDENVAKLVVDANGDTTESDDEKKAYATNNIKYNFGLPRFRKNVNFWWDIDKNVVNYWVVGTTAPTPKTNIDWSEISISNANQLTWFMKVVNNSEDVVDASGKLKINSSINASTIRSATVKLTANIDLSSRVWTPIGQYHSNNFSGEFNGGGYTISGLACVGMYLGDKSTMSREISGLFGKIGGAAGGSVYNLTMTGSRVTATHYAGTVVAVVDGDQSDLSYLQDITVDNSATRGYVSLVGSQTDFTTPNHDNFRAAGGIVGRVWDTVIFNNEVKGSADVDGVPDNFMLINTKVASNNQESVGGIVGHAVASYIAGNVVSYLELDNKGAYTTAMSAVGGIVGCAVGTDVISNRVGDYAPIATASDVAAAGDLQKMFNDDPDSISEYIKLKDHSTTVYSGGAIGIYHQTNSETSRYAVLSEIAVYFNMNHMITDGMVVGHYEGDGSTSYRYANNLYVAYNDGNLCDPNGYMLDHGTNWGVGRVSDSITHADAYETLDTGVYKFVGDGLTDIRNSIITSLTYISMGDGVANYSLMAHQYNAVSFTSTGGQANRITETNVPEFLKATSADTQTSAYRVQGINEWAPTTDIIQHYTPNLLTGNKLYINFWNEITNKKAFELTTKSGNVKFNWQSSGEHILYSLYGTETVTRNGYLTGVYEVSNADGYASKAKLHNLIRFRVGVNVGFNIKFTTDIPFSIPLGSEYYYFGTTDPNYSFTADGNNVQMTLYMGKDGYGNCIGLFANTRNINFNNFNISNGDSDPGIIANYYVGALVGKSINNMVNSSGTRINAEITSCSSSATVTGRAAVGGLVGYSENLTIKGTNDSTYGVMSGSVTGKGVVTGSAEASDSGPFVVEGSTVGVHLGGLVGMARQNLTIQYMNMTGSVRLDDSIDSAYANAVGGLVGSYKDSDTAANPCCIGIFDCNVGSSSTMATITTSKTVGSLYVASYIGGAVGYAAESKDGMNNATATTENTLYSLITGVNVYATLCGLNYIGGIVGKYQGHISYCYYNGTIRSDGSYAGGMVGHCAWGDIIECETGNYAVIYATAYAGGIAGYFTSDGSSRYYIENCVNNAPIYCYGWNTTANLSTAYTRIGGIVGCIDDGQVNDCLNYGDINDDRDDWISIIGGIVGYSWSSIISGNTNYGDISLSSATNVGGIVGYYNFDANAARLVENNNTYSSTILQGSSYVGGIFGTYDYTSTQANLRLVKNNKLGSTNYPVEIGAISNVGSFAGRISKAIANYVWFDNSEVSNSNYVALLSAQENVAGAAPIYDTCSSGGNFVFKQFDMSNVHGAYIKNGTGNAGLYCRIDGGTWPPAISGTVTYAGIKQISTGGYKDLSTTNSGVAYQAQVYASGGSLYAKAKHANLDWTGEDTAQSISVVNNFTYHSEEIGVRDGASVFKIEIEIRYSNIAFRQKWNTNLEGWDASFYSWTTQSYS